MRRTIHNAADMGVAPPAGKCETDVSTHHMLCNGENLFAQPYDLEGNAPEGIFDAGWIPAEFSGQDRPADIIRQSYADLCFDFDHFFGSSWKPVGCQLPPSRLRRATSLEGGGKALFRRQKAPSVRELARSA